MTESGQGLFPDFPPPPPSASRSLDSAEVSLAQLETLTAKAYKTLKARLRAGDIRPLREEGTALIYSAPAALEAIYAPSGSTATRSLAGERARLAARQSERLELELAERRRELIAITEIEGVLEPILVALRARLLALGANVAPLTAPLLKRRSLVKQVARTIQAAVDDALHELAGLVDALDAAGAFGPPPPDDPVGLAPEAPESPAASPSKARKPEKRTKKSAPKS